MISRFIFFSFIFIIIGGFLLHFDVDVPYLMGWLGKLPGDMYLKKNDMIVHVPITSSMLVSFVLSICLSAFKKKK